MRTGIRTYWYKQSNQIRHHYIIILTSSKGLGLLSPCEETTTATTGETTTTTAEETTTTAAEETTTAAEETTTPGGEETTTPVETTTTAAPCGGILGNQFVKKM